MGATGQSRIRHDSRLWKLVWPFIAVVLLQGLLGVGSLYLISGVRAYVGGESLWSKGQKDAAKASRGTRAPGSRPVRAAV